MKSMDLAKWILITEWFWPENENRQKELTRTLFENLESNELEKVVIYAETLEGLDDFLRDEKLEIFASLSRPTYRSLIEDANSYAPNRQIVIANNDISFRYFENFESNKSTVYCSTRYELHGNDLIWFDDIYDHRVKGNKKKNHIWSQDAWFFHTPLDLKGGNYVMGTPACDNKIARHFMMSGYRILNNGRDIKLAHHHEELGRNYNKTKLPSPYLYPAITGKNRIVFFPKHPPYGSKLRFHNWHIWRSLFLSRWDFLFTLRLLINKFFFKKKSSYDLEYDPALKWQRRRTKTS